MGYPHPSGFQIRDTCSSNHTATAAIGRSVARASTLATRWIERRIGFHILVTWATSTTGTAVTPQWVAEVPGAVKDQKEARRIFESYEVEYRNVLYAPWGIVANVDRDTIRERARRN